MQDAQEFTVFNDPVKMFIRDIHLLERDEGDPNYYRFIDKKIKKVDIMGVVTEVRALPNAHLYRVDDGTGEILCRHHHHSERTLQDLAELEKLQDLVAELNFRNPSCVGESMESILEEGFKKHAQFMSSLDQSDTAHLQGFIADFHGTRQINSFRLYKVSRFEDEIDRIFELSHIYSTVYKKD